MGAAKTILAMASNSTYVVKIRESASMLGATTAFVDSSQEMIAKVQEIRPSLLIFELASVQPNWQEAMQAAKQAGISVIAYGPHDDEQLRQQAIESGCDEVYASSSFKLEVSDILEKFLANA